MAGPPRQQPRIAPGSRRDLGLLTWSATRVAGRVLRTEPPKLFTIMGRHRSLLRGWLRFAGRLMPRGRLPRRDTELVILRVAHLRGCAYEHHHHVRLGKRAGLTNADLAGIEQGPGAPGWTPREQAILTAVDELHATQDLSDGTWARLAGFLSERDLIELVLLAAHYEMLATFIGTLRIAPDA